MTERILCLFASHTIPRGGYGAGLYSFLLFDTPLSPCRVIHEAYQPFTGYTDEPMQGQMIGTEWYDEYHQSGGERG